MGYDAYKPQDFPHHVRHIVGLVTDTAGNPLTSGIASSYERITAASANDGDRYFWYVMALGNETKLFCYFAKMADSGIADLYLNGVLDTAGFDLYAAALAAYLVSITLTTKPKPGLNTFEMRINGKNAASSDYCLQMYPGGSMGFRA
jgi:hypothetical protein